MSDYKKITKKNVWIEAAKEKIFNNDNIANNNIKLLMCAYDEVQREIEDKIAALYQKYALENKINLSSAKQVLRGSEFNSFRMNLESYIKAIEKEGKDSVIIKELDILCHKARINRLELLQADIYKHMGELADKTDEGLIDILSDTVKVNYSNELFNIQKAVNKVFPVSKIDDNVIQILLNENWSGKTFSKRIWDNTDFLAEQLSKNITKRMISGQSLQSSITELDSIMKKGRYVTGRLIYTESAHIAEQARLLSYDELNVTKYMFVGGTELRFNCSCSSLNNLVFDIKDAKEGINYPPIHPFCKCTTVPYFDDEFTSSIKDAEHFQDNMTKKEWEEKYLVKDTESFYNKANGALNDKNDPNGHKRELHAKRYYESVRKRNKENEINVISKHSGFPKKEVEKAYNHIFINEYDLGETVRRFDEDYDMAQSWQRLFEGKDIKEHDLVLLKHEAMEFDLMNEDGLYYEEAHNIAEHKYNYSKALDDWLQKRGDK